MDGDFDELREILSGRCKRSAKKPRLIGLVEGRSKSAIAIAGFLAGVNGALIEFIMPVRRSPPAPDI